MKNNIEKVYGKLPKKKVDLKKHKIALGLLDNFNYDFEYLAEESGRLSYAVFEFWDEKYDQWFDIGREIYDVYFNNTESFVTEADIVDDMEILNEIKTRAEELGIDVYEVYPNWEEHMREIEYVKELEEKFNSNKEQFRNESKSI